MFTNTAKNFRGLLKTEEMKSIEFTYKAKTYYALVRTTLFETYCHHYITIMNGKLEALFFGHHLYIEQNGEINSVTVTTDSEINEIKNAILGSLYKERMNEEMHFHKNVEKYSLSGHKKAVA